MKKLIHIEIRHKYCRIHFSIILERVGRIEICLYLFTLSLSPVLKIGLTFAFFHVHGKPPDSMPLLIIYVKEGVKVFKAIFNNLRCNVYNILIKYISYV